MTASLLEFQGVTHTPTLRGAHLTVRPGEFTAVLAPRGAGKSAVLALARGLARPATGRVLLKGNDLAALSRTDLARLSVTTVTRIPQAADTALDPALTAVENIALRHTLDGAPADTSRQQALSVLFQLELGEVADRLPGRLSPAQRRAVIIARALVADRPLILADEPVAGLDVELADTVLALLRARGAAGGAVVMTTREPEHAVWADRVFLLRNGSLTDPADPAAPVELPAGPPVNGSRRRRRALLPLRPLRRGCVIEA